MFLSGRIIKFVFISSFFISPMTLNAGIIRIESFEALREHITNRVNLKKMDDPSQDGKMAFILDFHGVLVNETFQPSPLKEDVSEEIAKKPLLSEKNGAREILEFFRKNEIPYVIATAWDQFRPVLDEVIKLGFGDLFDIEPASISQKDWSVPEDFSLGKDENGKPLQLKGFRLGRLLALKSKKTIIAPEAQDNDHYYRQKIFALEAFFSLGVPKEDKIDFSKLSCIGVVDDSKWNLDIAEKDFPASIHYKDGVELLLFHFESPADEDSDSDSDSENGDSESSSEDDIEGAGRVVVPASDESKTPINNVEIGCSASASS